VCLSRLRSIQVLRAVAVLGVVLCHGAGFGYGAAGVDLFFVISGFIMATVAPGRTPSEFLTARIWRIYPLYWIDLIPWLFVAAHLHLLSPAKLLSSLTLWPAYGSFVRPALPAGWSLCYEMLFYLATAMALVFGSRKVIAVYLTALAASVVWPSALLTFVGNSITLEFLAGIAIARFRPRLSPWWLLPAAVIFAFSNPQWDIVIAHSLSRVVLVGIPAAITVAVAIANEHRFGKAFDAPVFLGDASYSIYLTHQLVLLALWPRTLGIVLVLLAGSSFHLAVEKPLLSLRTAHLKKMLRQRA
jgi:exopolysaccharide production protein ExoZ